MNIIYARAATGTRFIASATTAPSPTSSRSPLITADSPKSVAIVPTTFSFAINPVIALATNFHEAIPTTGIRIQSIGPQIAASIELLPSSAACLKAGVKELITVIRTLHTSIIVPAFTI